MPETLRQLLTGLRTLLVLTVILGIGYPALVLGVGRLGFEHQRHGSLVSRDGQVVGSTLIGQRFDGDRWFQPRPSVADYDGLASGGTNTGPTDGELAATIQQRRAEIARRDGVPADAVPADALTASGSGLEPFISPEYARQQVNRVARSRQQPVDRVRAIVDGQVQGRALGFLGEPRVNVVELNLGLERLA